MKKAMLNQPGYLVYPGQFVPLHNESEIKQVLKKSFAGGAIIYPPVNFTETADTINIEIAIPGVKKEDLVIFTDKDILSVCVVHKEPLRGKGQEIKLHEFNNNFFYRHIELPATADSVFTHAEYKSGVLYLHVPKTTLPSKKSHNRIIVY